MKHTLEEIKDAQRRRMALPVVDEEFTPEYGCEYGYDPQKDMLCDSSRVEDRLKAVEEGYGIDKLKDDVDYRVRLAIARKGLNIPQFIKDSSPIVRLEVAKHFPDRLQDDVNSAVRMEALKHLS